MVTVNHSGPVSPFVYQKPESSKVLITNSLFFKFSERIPHTLLEAVIIYFELFFSTIFSLLEFIVSLTFAGCSYFILLPPTKYKPIKTIISCIIFVLHMMIVTVRTLHHVKN